MDRSDPDGQPHRHPFLDTDIFHYSDPEHLVARGLDAAEAASAPPELVVSDPSLRPVARIWSGPRYRVVRKTQRNSRPGTSKKRSSTPNCRGGAAKDRAEEADCVAREAG